MQNPISMEITRNGLIISAVKVIMPTWDRKGDDGKTYVSIPFLGLETYGINDEDVDLAIEEVIKCFVIAAEKNGLGLESELEFLGWEKVQNQPIEKEHSLFNVIPKESVYESIVNTGDTRALMFEIA